MVGYSKKVDYKIDKGSELILGVLPGVKESAFEKGLPEAVVVAIGERKLSDGYVVPEHVFSRPLNDYKERK